MRTIRVFEALRLRRVYRSGVVLALLFANSSAKAVDVDGRALIYSVGTESCGHFNAERKAGRDNPYLGWLGGYLSAINRVTPETYDIRGGTDMDGIMLWLDKYCDSHALDTISDAVEALVLELHPRRITKGP